MEMTVFNALINNAAILLMLSIIYDLSYTLPIRFRRTRPVFSGLLIAMMCVATMLANFELVPGVYYDTRTILISVTALIFGWIPTAITAAAALLTRFIIGGAGTLAGVLIILASALIGLFWRRLTYKSPAKRRWIHILCMSVAVHAVMMAFTILLPVPGRMQIMSIIAAPMMIVYPIASVLLSILLLRQQDLRQTQSQLEQSEERFRRLFDQAPLGYQSLDAQGNFIEVNERWLSMLGYSKEEVIGKWFGDFLPPSSRDAFRERFALYKTLGYIYSEYEMFHKDGTRMVLAFEGKIAYGPDGEFKQTHSMVYDITSQKAAEEELRVSEEQYRRLYETMAQGVVYQNAKGAVLSANPAAQRILGLSLERLQSMTSMDPDWRSIREDGSPLEGPDHPSMVALRTGKPFGPVTIGVFQPKLNEHVWISINAIPLFHPDEAEPYQVYTTFQDVTGEYIANQRYQLLFREMVDGFALHEMIWDEQGKPKDYRFLAVNPAFEQMTGLKAEEIVGKTVLEVIPDTESYWIESYATVVRTGAPIRFNNFAVSTGKYFEVSAYKPAHNQFACTFADVTQRVQAEEVTKKVLSRFRALLDNSPGPIVIVDERGGIAELSSVAMKIFGLSQDNVRAGKDPKPAPEVITRKIAAAMANPDAGRLESENLDVFTIDGKKRYFESFLFPIHGQDLSEKLFGYLAIDVTPRKQAEEELVHLSYHDFLTGIYNRRYYEEELKRLDRPEHLPLSIIMADINGVKLVNDAFGHAEGDRLINECCSIIAGCCRKTDTMARIGGDEFGILMPHTDHNTAMEILRKIQAALADFDENDNHSKFRHSVSLGFSTKRTADEDVAKLINIAEEYMYQRKLLEHTSSHSAIISSMKTTMNEKSQETEEHAERLAILTKAVATEMNLPQSDQDRLELLATLHDIGKIGISDQILTKPGKLTDEEWVKMRRHPEIGYRIARAIPELMPVAKGILCHHERWDGNGYPQGLSKEMIPLPARILSIVDAYDAMTQDRPYSKAISHEAAVEEVKRNAGTQFDPYIVNVFIEVLEKWRAQRQGHKEIQHS